MLQRLLQCSSWLHKLCHSAVHCHVPDLLRRLTAARFSVLQGLPLHGATASQGLALWVCLLGVPV
jgi:hypothetical protein